MKDPNVLWIAVLNGVFGSMAAFGTDQELMQRLLTLETREASQKTIIATIFATIPLLMLYLSVGTLLFVFYAQNPSLPLPDNADKILSHFTVQVLPVGLKGVILMAIIMASIDSPLSSLSSSFVTDIYRPLIQKTGTEALPHYLALRGGPRLILAFIAYSCRSAEACSGCLQGQRRRRRHWACSCWAAYEAAVCGNISVFMRRGASDATFQNTAGERGLELDDSDRHGRPLFPGLALLDRAGEGRGPRFYALHPKPYPYLIALKSCSFSFIPSSTVSRSLAFLVSSTHSLASRPRLGFPFIVDQSFRVSCLSPRGARRGRADQSADHESRYYSPLRFWQVLLTIVKPRR